MAVPNKTLRPIHFPNISKNKQKQFFKWSFWSRLWKTWDRTSSQYKQSSDFFETPQYWVDVLKGLINLTSFFGPCNRHKVVRKHSPCPCDQVNPEFSYNDILQINKKHFVFRPTCQYHFPWYKNQKHDAWLYHSVDQTREELWFIAARANMRTVSHILCSLLQGSPTCLGQRTTWKDEKGSLFWRVAHKCWHSLQNGNRILGWFAFH